MKKLVFTLLCAFALAKGADSTKCEFVEYLAKEARQRLSDLQLSQAPAELKKYLYDLEYMAYFRHLSQLKDCKKSVK